MKQPNWQAWEYRVLAEGHDVGKTAQLIQRTEREVRQKLDSLNSTVGSWYARNRIPAAPTNYWRMYRLAYTVWNRDFSDRVEEDKIETQIIDTLNFCFEKFDATKGNQTLTIERRFCKHFAYWFARHLRDGLWDDRYDRRKSTLRYLEWKATLRHHDEEHPYKDWCRMVKERAIMRLDREAREFIRLKLIEELTLKETARLMGTPERTIKRRYGSDQIYDLIKKEIMTMFLKIPQSSLEQLVWTLFYENKFSRDKICRLFNVPRATVDNLIRDITSKVYDRIELSAAERLFE